MYFSLPKYFLKTNFYLLDFTLQDFLYHLMELNEFYLNNQRVDPWIWEGHGFVLAAHEAIMTSLRS